VLGYENHYFLCSEQASFESLNNVCKAMVTCGSWITFLNLENLSTHIMSSLSNVLSQFNQRKEQIQINNEPYKLCNTHPLFACFAQTVEEKGKQLNNSKIDSLKITRIEHHLNLISKDILDKFQVVHIKFSNLSSFFSSNLIAHGFDISNQLTVQNGLKKKFLLTNLNLLFF
jgi:hypothetical protein